MVLMRVAATEEVEYRSALTSEFKKTNGYTCCTCSNKNKFCMHDVHMYTYMYTYTYVHTYIHSYIHSTCMYVHMYMYVHVCAHTYTYNNKRIKSKIGIKYAHVCIIITIPVIKKYIVTCTFYF